MSTSKPGARRRTPRGDSDFETWLKSAFSRHDAFTALIILVRIADLKVTPLASTFLNVMGDEVNWPQMAALLSGSGQAWDGAAFFAVTDTDGPIGNAPARARLRALEERIREDRLVLNEGQLFDLWGRRLMVEEESTH